MARGIKSFVVQGTQDLSLDAQGNLATVSGQDEIEDRVNSSILLYRGEDIWNLQFGIDYEAFNALSPLDRSFLSSSIIGHILSLEGVSGASVQSEMLDANTRALNLSIQVETNSGTFTTTATI